MTFQNPGSFVAQQAGSLHTPEGAVPTLPQHEFNHASVRVAPASWESNCWSTPWAAATATTRSPKAQPQDTAPAPLPVAAGLKAVENPQTLRTLVPAPQSRGPL